MSKLVKSLLFLILMCGSYYLIVGFLESDKNHNSKELANEMVNTLYVPEILTSSGDDNPVKLTKYEIIHQCRTDKQEFERVTKLWLASLEETTEVLSETYRLKDIVMTLKLQEKNVDVFKLPLALEHFYKPTVDIDQSDFIESISNNYNTSILVDDIILWNKITPNDILKASSYTPSDILEMLRGRRANKITFELVFPKIKDISSVLKNRHENLGGYLATMGFSDLLRLYFDHGGKALDLPWQNNSLEKLVSFYKADLDSKYQPIFEMLTAQGMEVRYTIGVDGTVEIGPEQEQTRLSLSDLSLFQQKGIHFREIQDKEEMLKSNPYNELFKRLYSHKESFFINNGVKSLNYYESCIDLVDRAEIGVKKYELNDVLRDKSNQAGESRNSLKESLALRNRLAEIEPGMVDCFDHDPHFIYLLPDRMTEKQFSQLVGWTTRIGKGESPQSIVEEALKEDLSDSQKAQLLATFLLTRGSQVSLLVNHDLMPSQEEFFDLLVSGYGSFIDISHIALLDQLGYDLNLPTKNDRSLVEIFTSQCKISNVIWLYENQFTYRFSTDRADALAIALRSNCDEKNFDKLLLILSVLKFQPEIKDYHLKRMAEIRQTNYELYNEIIKHDERLKIDDSTKPSGYYCSAFTI
ncbi:hypothetical protein [Pleionea litopenaei]|uniref:Uncharacterized protein n=1 Tax=Pleionea litopenaei TaxID=3070815 RepID=A0AA51RUY2_9GAMM|nr:hypothetical protein [Pleionea sp. HL-JVS1]WMS87944.1 hypothetical protein Q9312_03245 [Pleionea sp. HL-JVS1]